MEGTLTGMGRRGFEAEGPWFTTPPHEGPLETCMLLDLKLLMALQ